jgi:hypothetical protein
VTITEVKNKDGREQCHGAMMTLKNARVAIEKAAKAAREDATAFSRAVIAEEKRLVALAAPEETRLQGLRDAWDAEIEREKQAKLAAEKARVDSIKARIERFMIDAVTVSDLSSAAIDAHATKLSESVISLDEYMEFSGEAQMKRDDTVKWLRERQRQAAEREAEAARLAAEREALERQRAEEATRLAAERAELDRLRSEQEERERVAAAARAEQEAKDRAERERVEAEQRAARERAAAAMRAEQEAHEARMREQQAELARQQAEIDRQRAEAERIERQRQEAIEAAQKLETDHAEALIENARIDAEAAAATEARRLEQERQAAEAERLRRERVQFEMNGPDARDMIEVLAAHYQVEQETVLQWINRWVWSEVEITA